MPTQLFPRIKISFWLLAMTPGLLIIALSIHQAVTH